MSERDERGERSLRVAETALAAGAWLLGAAVFYRDQIFSGFDTLIGERGDARLQVFLHEHWWQAVRGEVPWRSPPMFHPISGVLGYSDTNLLNAALYVPARAIGFDPFVATGLTLIALSAIGFAAFWVILRRHVGVGAGTAAALGLAATFSNNLFVDSGHPQLFAVHYVPVVVLVGLEALVAASRRRSLVLAGGCGLLFGLLITSAFYIGWFSAVATAVVAGFAGLLLVIRDGPAALVEVVRRHAPQGLAGATGLAVGLVPFAAVYLPTRRQFGSRPLSEVTNLQPRPADLFNVGDRNLLWGWAERAAFDDEQRLQALHRAVGLTPLLAVAIVVAAVGLGRAFAFRRVGGRGAVGLGLCLGALAAALLPIHFGTFDLWSQIYRLVPGGSVIRVPGRFGILAVYLGCLAVGMFLALPPPSRRRSSWIWIAPTVAVLIALEQVNLTTMYRQYDRAAELAALERAEDPPAECTSFYLVDPLRTVYDGILIDAMLVAQHVGVPTVNGYSGQSPPGWNLRPWLDDYLPLVAAWSADHDLQPGLCRFDQVMSQWMPADVGGVTVG